MTRQGRLGMPNQQAGVALVMLLWFIAAMSLLVTGLMGEAKLDIRLSQLYLRQAQAEALGDGAAQRAMQAMLEKISSGEPVPAVFEWRDERNGVDIRVRMRSVSGYVELNSAPEELLIELFQQLGELEPQDAALLANTVVRWRGVKPELEAPEPGYRYGWFEAPEDLLLVEGVTRQLYGKIKAALSVTKNWQTGVDLMSAPPEVLKMLAEGDDALVSHWQQAQLEPEPGVVQQPVKVGLISSSSKPIYRIEANVRFADGVAFQRVRWAEYGQQGLDRLPWRFFRTEPVIRADQVELSGN